MRQITRYLVLVISLTLLAIAHSPWLTSKLFDWCNAWAYKHGDLYRFSTLSAYRLELEGCGIQDEGLKARKGSKTDVFLLGDSFFKTLMLNPALSANFNSVRYVPWEEQMIVPPISNANKTVLIIGTVERNALRGKPLTNIVEGSSGAYEKKKLMPTKLARVAGIESGLKQLYFFDPISMCVKEIKASINYTLFKRVDEAVVLDDQRNFLFLKETIIGKTSSFEQIEERQIDSAVQMYNQLYSHYKQMGFDEVYLSIIPNKVSIVAPSLAGTYNMKANRIGKHSTIKVPVLDVYSVFKARSDQGSGLYHRNDTHWNCEGEKLFIDLLKSSIYGPSFAQEEAGL